MTRHRAMRMLIELALGTRNDIRHVRRWGMRVELGIECDTWVNKCPFVHGVGDRRSLSNWGGDAARYIASRFHSEDTLPKLVPIAPPVPRAVVSYLIAIVVL